MKSPFWSTIIESANYVAYLATARAFKPKGIPTPKPTPIITKKETNIAMQQQHLVQPSFLGVSST